MAGYIFQKLASNYVGEQVSCEMASTSGGRAARRKRRSERRGARKKFKQEVMKDWDRHQGYPYILSYRGGAIKENSTPFLFSRAQIYGLDYLDVTFQG